MNEQALKEAVAQARHDLRNPVSHILGFAEWLLEDPAQGEFRTLLEEIGRLGNAMLSLINGHLAWPANNLSELQVQLQEPCQRIVSLAQAALRQPQAERSETADDLLRIAQAAKEVLRLSETILPPLQLLLDKDPTVNPMRGQAVPAANAGRGKGSVLVVDDLQEIRQMLQVRLSELGYTVHLASSGPQALTLLNTTPVDVILLDIGMPGMDGIEVLRQLKKIETTQHIPVLMLTFSESAEQLALCVKLGAEGSISKPFKDVLLQARLETALGKGGITPSKPERWSQS